MRHVADAKTGLEVPVPVPARNGDAADRALQYDTWHTARVVAALARSVADPDRRAAATELSDRAWAVLDPLTGKLRSQVVHADLADYNVVAQRDHAGRPSPTGVIDFGDVVRSGPPPIERGWRQRLIDTSGRA